MAKLLLALVGLIPFIIKILRKSSEADLHKPTSTSEISCAELYCILRKKFPTKGELYLSDKIYKLCNFKDIGRFLKQDKTNSIKYVTDWWDCDDASYRLMGQFSIPDWSSLAFGIVWSEKHALNCFISEERIFYFVEPQRDLIQENLKEWQGSHIRFIMI